ncbi:BTB and MATH domain-containing protein 36-like isoform X1 [Oculina patagonica]
MACIALTSEKTNNEEDSTDAEITDEELEEEEVNHRFAEPWEDSDVILVVENEKFHVHRLILSMNSPMFKAMFKSEFKEATNNEIPLPDKNASEILDFIKQLYIHVERQEITLESVEHLLKLSDEYQVKVIFDSCVKFLENQLKTEGNVMKILRLASLYTLENIQESCYNLVREMELKSILKASKEQNLDKETVEMMLSRRIERLEKFLNKLYPEFIGMVDHCLKMWHEAKWPMKWCPQHFDTGRGRFRSSIDECILEECSICKEMLATIMQNTPGWWSEQSSIQEFFKLITGKQAENRGLGRFKN